MPQHYSFMPMFIPSSITDRHYGTRQVQILSGNLCLVYIKERARQFSSNQNYNRVAISDYNLLSILALKGRLNYNKGILMHKIKSGKVPPALNANSSFNQSHSAKLEIPVPRTDLFKTCLVYSGSFVCLFVCLFVVVVVNSVTP